ncbi:hypothetical protein G9A89_007861 [Geosiphon pyriformis]|nr:hypothetical protein G9A89_007861 [Geosiphon pyriformis]
MAKITKFKVATTLDTATLEYYQSIYTHCKQRFNISDGIEIVKRTLYLYIENCINNYFLGNYNISEVKNNLYNNLVYYLRLGTEDLNSETLATYFQELNYNIIKYCEEKYPVQSKYSFNFESETETSNKDKQKPKQHSKTTPNTPILTKTTAKHLQTPEQGTSLSKSPIQQQEPILTSTNLIDYLTENQSEETELEQETEDSEMKKKWPPHISQKSLSSQKKTAKPVLKNGLTKSQKQEMQIIRPHAPEDLNSAIQHAKRYKMAMEKANCTKLVNLAIGETSSAAEEKIDQLTKKVENYFTNQQQQQLQRYQPPQQ